MIDEGRRVLLLMLDPVALMAWVLLTLNLMLVRRRVAGFVRACLTATTLVFCFAASPFAANQLLGWLEAKARDLAICPPPPPASVFVVLAGGAKRAAGDADDIAQMELPTFRRTVAAAHLVLRTPESLLLLSGGAGDAAREADLMRTLATALGVPFERISEERDSKTTFENARNTLPLLAGLNGRSVYLVTSAMHMRRASAAFRAAGHHICPLPVDFQRMQPEGFDAAIPAITSLQKTADGVREVVGYELYRWQAWVRRSAADA